MKKTIMILIIMAAALMALPTMAQQNWRNQQSVFGQQYQQRSITTQTGGYHSGTYNSGTYRAGTFHSTGSTMMRTGSSYSSRPTINQYGSAVSNGGPRRSSIKGGSGPHRGLINHGGGDDPDPGEGGGGGGGGDPDPGSGSGGIGTPPDDDGTPPNGFPLGDAVLPLLFMSLAFCGYLYLRRKRSAA